jgi:phosphoribosylformimino-5-aminoimidazole carboxamide ribotide isomerase
MQIIPVIDLAQGQVVRAVRGDRASYAPVESPLCASSDPCTVARHLLAACDSALLYVADIDALTGRLPQAHLITKLLETLPGMQLWLDAGFSSLAQAQACIATWCRTAGHPDAAFARRITPVLGTESLLPESLAQDAEVRSDWVLSLDQRQGMRLGAHEWFEHPQCWPAHVIVMNLDHVGAANGPDLDALRDVMTFNSRLQAPRRIMGAGGIRNLRDCEHAAHAGAQGWLIASALHDLRIAPKTPAVHSHDTGN